MLLTWIGVCSAVPSFYSREEIVMLGCYGSDLSLNDRFFPRAHSVTVRFFLNVESPTLDRRLRSFELGERTKLCLCAGVKVTRCYKGTRVSCLLNSETKRDLRRVRAAFCSSSRAINCISSSSLFEPFLLSGLARACLGGPSE